MAGDQYSRHAGQGGNKGGNDSYAAWFGTVTYHLVFVSGSISVGPGVKSPDRYDMINWASTPLNPPHAWKIDGGLFLWIVAPAPS